jgi:hypothetical protein
LLTVETSVSDTRVVDIVLIDESANLFEGGVCRRSATVFLRRVHERNLNSRRDKVTEVSSPGVGRERRGAGLIARDLIVGPGGIGNERVAEEERNDRV